MSDGGELVEFLRRIFERRSERQAEKAGAHKSSRNMGPSRIIGILGSARQDGNTAALTAAVFQNFNDARMIDLNKLSIAPYNYDNDHEADDFLDLAHMMAEADAIVFASPVYWYSMSAQLKVFFDRLTDLTKAHKALGRRLAGKPVFVVATGSAESPPSSFEYPFSETARYFDMRWGGMLYASFRDQPLLSEETQNKTAAFASVVASAAADTGTREAA